MSRIGSFNLNSLGVRSRLSPQAPFTSYQVSNGVKLPIRMSLSVPHAPQVAASKKGTAKTK